jgi:hypothetical protein
MKDMTLIRYALIALIVVILGAFLGWYLFVSRQVAQTQSSDAARGFGVAPSFGGSLGNTYQNVTGSFGGSASVVAGKSAPRLWQVTMTPVAGEGFMASSSELFFAERATGNVLRANPADSSVVRLTNTLFAKTYGALFASDGKVALSSLAENGATQTFAGSATSSASEGPQALSGADLPPRIVTLAARSSPDTLFFIVQTPQGGAVGYTCDWACASRKQIFSSALSQWRAYYLNDGNLFIVQKSSDGIDGYAFKLQSGAAADYLGPVPGLSILPRENSTALLYSSSGQGGVGLFARTSGDSSVIQLPVRTVVDKCVWAPGKDLIAYCAVPVSLSSSSFLRDWYSGALHTTDAWYKVDVSSGQAEKLFVTDSSLSLDVHDPKVDQNGAYLAFTNGFDGTLWMLRVAP